MNPLRSVWNHENRSGTRIPPLQGLSEARWAVIKYPISYQEVTDSGMILQRHERGDYVITDQGFKTLTAISQLYQLLNP